MIYFLKVVAFIEEKTTHIVEKTPMKEKDFPQVMFAPRLDLDLRSSSKWNWLRGFPWLRIFSCPIIWYTNPISTSLILIKYGKMAPTRGMSSTCSGRSRMVIFNCWFSDIAYYGKGSSNSESGTGNFSDNNTGELLDLNTVWQGRCMVWKPRIKARKYHPQVVFFISAPTDEWVI